jgi:RimJ/RimL family protein N-acetyltransferase
MLVGKYVALRALEPSDLFQMQEWRNNEAMRRYYREYRELSMYDQEVWYKYTCCGNRDYCMFGITFYNEEQHRDHAPLQGQLLGICGLTNINWVLRSAELSFYIGFDNLYCDKTYAPDAVNIMLQYSFDTLNMHKVWAEIYNFDEQKNTLFKIMGFNKDAELRDNAFDKGCYSNSFIYSLLEQEYKSSSALVCK